MADIAGGLAKAMVDISAANALRLQTARTGTYANTKLLLLLSPVSVASSQRFVTGELHNSGPGVTRGTYT